MRDACHVRVRKHNTKHRLTAFTPIFVLEGDVSGSAAQVWRCITLIEATSCSLRGLISYLVVNAGKVKDCPFLPSLSRYST